MVKASVAARTIDSPFPVALEMAEGVSAGHASVDPMSAENLLTSSRLGERIKRLRLKRSMGLVELGRKAGLSASFLSQLETGRVVPTLRNLARISLVFGKDLSYFFDSNDPNSQRVFRIQRKKDRVRLPVGTPNPDYIAESFGILVPEGGLRPCMAEFLAGEEHQPFHPHMYPGVEMVYVLSGQLEVTRRGEPHTLEARDVLYISGETQRTYRAAGKKSAQALIISFDAENGELRRTRRKISGNEA
ncbi:cupin domain-containing protein [Granulicella sp. 5B5]|uniref:helix-turn-helix domain-containing protein n=1 Tax=Granulicella sp. 5B5 TaxID=1617967 RepID=UPI0015F65670|nr:XRE family transcriptional regulator [Granulicella sp. 5B5]QMV17600.1 cupin domain-containing protein [Granulicella sp. 5B5]